MSRLALANILVGFVVLSLAAMAGAFIANDLTHGFLRDKAFVDSWEAVLQRSAHGHTNLFAMTHVLLGLTLSYSPLNGRIKCMQSCGLFLGVVAMGPLMYLRSRSAPVDGFDPVELGIGLCLTCALAALVTHAFGLAFKLFRAG